MKTSVFTIILVLISLSTFAIKEDSSQMIWYEGNVISLSSKTMTMNELFSFYKSTPDYSQSGEYRIGYQSMSFKRDTLVNSYEYETYPVVYSDFRSNILGIQRNIKQWKKLSLNHSLAISLSREDSKYWGTLRSFNSTNALTFDSLDRVLTTYQVTKQIQAFRQTRRLGLVYQNSINLEVFKWLRLDLSLRHSVYFKYKDRLFLQETVQKDTVNHRYDNNIGHWEDRVCYICFSKVSLYSKSKPVGTFTEYKGKTSLQYDAILQLKPTVILGKQKKLEMYLAAGAVLGTVYGKQYLAGQRGITYGFGMGYRLGN